MISTKRARVIGIVERAAEKRLRETLDGGEWRLEFVGDVGDEVPADTLETAKFADVVKNDYGAGRFFIGRATGCGDIQSFHRRSGDGETLSLSDAHGDVGLQAFIAAQGATNEAQKVRVADYFDERAAFGAGGIHVQDF